MVGALGHNVPRVFTIVSRALHPRRAGRVIGGNYLVSEPSMAITMGPIVFVVGGVRGLGSLAGCFIASLIWGSCRPSRWCWTFVRDLLGRLGST